MNHFSDFINSETLDKMLATMTANNFEIMLKYKNIKYKYCFIFSYLSKVCLQYTNTLHKCNWYLYLTVTDALIMAEYFCSILCNIILTLHLRGTHCTVIVTSYCANTHKKHDISL